MSVETRFVYRCPTCHLLFVEENQESRWHIADAVDECITIHLPNGRTMMTNACDEGFFCFNLTTDEPYKFSCEKMSFNPASMRAHLCMKKHASSESPEEKACTTKKRRVQK